MTRSPDAGLVMPEVGTITDPSEFATLRHEWDALVPAMRRPSPFLLHGWLLGLVAAPSDRGRLTRPRRARGGPAHRRVAALRATPLRRARRALPRRRRGRARRRPRRGRGGPVDGRAPARAGRRRRRGLRRPLRPPAGEPARRSPRAGALRLIDRAEAPVMDLDGGWDAVYRADVGEAAQPARPAAAPARRASARSRSRSRATSSELAPALEEAFRLHAARWRDRPEASGFATARGRGVPPCGAAGAGAARGRRGSRCCGSPAAPSPATTSSCSATACTSTSWRSTPRSPAGRRASSRRSRRSRRRRPRARGASSSSAAPSATSSSSPTGSSRSTRASASRPPGAGAPPRRARIRAVHARRRLKRTPVRRLYYEGLAPARRIARLVEQLDVGPPRHQGAGAQPGRARP